MATDLKHVRLFCVVLNFTFSDNNNNYYNKIYDDKTVKLIITFF